MACELERECKSSVQKRDWGGGNREQEREMWRGGGMEVVWRWKEKEGERGGVKGNEMCSLCVRVQAGIFLPGRSFLPGPCFHLSFTALIHESFHSQLNQLNGQTS